MLVSGFIAGPVLCIFFAFVCNITNCYLLEAMGRQEALTKVRARLDYIHCFAFIVYMFECAVSSVG